ncbi:MAG TPA: hypothetical protein VLX92_01595 [Kofleriaceae bacterium]|nr:hypothetical protein [Kofleriaceae bacterium]
MQARTIAIAVMLTSGVARADRAEPQASAPAGAVAPALMHRPPVPQPVPPGFVVPPEIAKLGKQLAGRYRCKGVTFNGDGSSRPMTASVSFKLDLGNGWIAMTLGEDKPGTLRVADYRTFDATAQQWTRIQLASTTAHVVSTSLGEKDGTWTWEGTASAPTATLQVRDYEQLAGGSLKMWGEALLSGTWQKRYEVTCTR